MANEQWVGATVVTDATDWNSEDLRKARRNGAVKFKVVAKSPTGKKTTYRYLLSSIPEMYLKNQNHTA